MYIGDVYKSKKTKYLHSLLEAVGNTGKVDI